jgi:hypothetical protein
MTTSRLELALQHNRTLALLREADHHISNGFGGWTDFGSLEKLAATFILPMRDGPLTREDLGPRGVEVVEAAIRGEDWGPLMKQFEADNYRDAAARYRTEGKADSAKRSDEYASRIYAALRAGTATARD